MDVRCPQCQTLYELDDSQVGRKAVTLKCSQCQHVFRLESRTPIVQENQRRWMVRRKEADDILYLNTFDVLHEWIMKEEVCEKDEISRTGDSWAVLGEIGELLPMFQVVASISALEGDAEDRPDVSSIATRVPDRRTTNPTPSGRKQKPSRERVRTAIQFGGEAPPASHEPMRAEDITKRARPSQVTPRDLPPSPVSNPEGTPTPAPAASSSGPDLSGEEEWDVDLSREAEHSDIVPVQSRRRSGVGLWIFLLAVVAVGVGAYVWMFERDMVEPQQEPAEVVPIGQPESTTPPEPSNLVAAARDAALEAAQSENDAVWTLWHDAASEPFYVALDTAYAAADEASVDVELDGMLQAARVALENGRLADANRTFRTVLAKDAQNPAAITGLGWTLLEQGQAEQAAAQFRQSMNLDPAYGDAYIGLGTAYRNLGEYKKAYDSYDLYLGRFPRGEKASIASYQMSQLRKQLGL